MEIDEAIDRVQTRIRREGLVVADPVATEEVAATEAELAPLRLPAEYRRLIERMDPAIPLVGRPNLHRLTFGLDCWRSHRMSGTFPTLLFTIAYESHMWLGIELQSDVSPGGELYHWTVDGAYSHVGRLPALLASLAEAPTTGPPNRFGQVSVAFHVGALRSGLSYFFKIEDWPEHWQRAEGIAPADPVPAGATATVADVLAARNGGPVHERIHVSVTRATSTGRESIVTVEDDTGSLVLRWPRKAGPAQAEVGGLFALEVRSRPSMRSDAAEQAELQRAYRTLSGDALAGGMEVAEELVTRFLDSFDRQGVDGEVIAARTLP